ncbi:serine hydrolase domain-containing protein [Kribbella sp. DT2]|uniref:serine hydrolase domain-containing protein n=1 Tax=Kribbella sp. DT2 TaxID=3393427 RepID=UPI003CF87B58
MPNPVDDRNLTEVLAYYDTWLAFNQRYQRVPGVQAAVYAGDRVALSTAYGLADVEGQVALTSEHLFRIASHSKTFTATAVLQLVEQGRVRLDDKASAHVTEIVGTPLGERTLRDLLSHAGGVTRDSLDSDFWQLVRPFPDRAGLLGVLKDGHVGGARGQRPVQVLQHRLRPARPGDRGGHRDVVQRARADRDRGQARTR